MKKPRETVSISLGPKREGSAVHFSVFSAHASCVYLALFYQGDETPFKELPMERNGDIWSAQAPFDHLTMEYAFRALGPYSPERGLLFDATKFLLDPYAPATNAPYGWGEPHPPLRSRLVDTAFDWEGVTPPRHPKSSLIIYEMHVRGFTQDPSSATTERGTFSAIEEKIPYLKELGITAVELMPIFEFNERNHPAFEETPPLYNYWGYATVSFFAPMQRFASQNATLELKRLIKALHQNGIEVLLDVVYNHTSEGNTPEYYESFRGLDNPIYYMLTDEGRYLNYSGCGNTLNCNQNHVRSFIIDSLIYWSETFHIDGVRFDLASTLTRAPDGTPLADPPLIRAITHHPQLKHLKLIAEPWDCGGLYHVGHFPYNERWSEWNGIYRDTVRRFMRGMPEACAFMQCLEGSPHLYKDPLSSVNFVTAHDGFTLYDLTAYTGKRNEENKENNRDGGNQNESWNCGVEGPSSQREVVVLRERQMRNFLIALFLSQGIPMLLMGDEYGHTRYGNNNSWCQDNELNYFLWSELDRHPDRLAFLRSLIAFRKRYFTTTPLCYAFHEHTPHLLSGTITHNDVPSVHFAFNIQDTEAHIPVHDSAAALYLSSGCICREGDVWKLSSYTSMIATKNQ